MPFFQVQYKTNSQTHTINLSCDDWQKARDFAQDIINGEITEIREFLYEDTRIKKDDKDYIHSKTITMKNEYGYISLRISKIKKSIEDNVLTQLVFNHLQIRSKKPDSVKISTKF